MADRLLHHVSDADLEAALRGLAPAVAWPTAVLPGGTDIAATVRTRIETLPVPRPGGRTAATWLAGLWRPSWRPARRALVLALVAVLALAAIAGALVLGLPGLRITLGDAPLGPPPTLAPAAVASPSTSPRDLGASMRLGEALDAGDPAGMDARAGFDVRMPTHPALGPPDAVYIDDSKGGQVTMLWGIRAGLPATLEPGVGLLLSQFRGVVDEGFFEKATSIGTTIERVQVGGDGGFWLSGEPHVLFWVGADGFVDDPRRWVGDVLLWSKGEITYRLETTLGRDEAIRLAEGLL